MIVFLCLRARELECALALRIAHSDTLFRRVTFFYELAGSHGHAHGAAKTFLDVFQLWFCQWGNLGSVLPGTRDMLRAQHDLVDFSQRFEVTPFDRLLAFQRRVLGLILPRARFLFSVVHKPLYVALWRVLAPRSTVACGLIRVNRRILPWSRNLCRAVHDPLDVVLRLVLAPTSPSSVFGHVGLGVVMDWLAGLPWDEIDKHENKMASKVVSGLQSIPEVRLLGPENLALRRPIFSFALADAHPHDIAHILNEFGVAVRGGHHCAQPLLDRLGLNATTRVSCAFYNTEEDVEVLFEALDKARELLV